MTPDSSAVFDLAGLIDLLRLGGPVVAVLVAMSVIALAIILLKCCTLGGMLMLHTKVKFALAGRTAHKVEAVKKKVFAEYEWKGVDPPVIGASLKDPQDVRRMVQRCDVMVNIAGPFMLTGAENLVEACLLFDTDYVDVNGEIPFTHKLLECHEYAEKNNVMVVPNAAFAGGATDVLATYAVDKLAEIKGKRCNKCVGFVTSTGQLAPSGGTVATREAMAGAMRDHGHLMMDPFSLGGRIGDGKRPEDQDRELHKIAKADMGMTVRAQRSFCARARSSNRAAACGGRRHTQTPALLWRRSRAFSVSDCPATWYGS